MEQIPQTKIQGALFIQAQAYVRRYMGIDKAQARQVLFETGLDLAQAAAAQESEFIVAFTLRKTPAFWQFWAYHFAKDDYLLAAELAGEKLSIQTYIARKKALAHKQRLAYELLSFLSKIKYYEKNSHTKSTTTRAFDAVRAGEAQGSVGI